MDEITSTIIGHLNRSELQIAEVLTKEALQHNPKNIDLLGLLATALLWQNRFEESIYVIEEILAMKPECITTLLGAGQAHLKLRQLENSLSYFNKILIIDPINIDATNGKAQTYIEMGKNQEAVDLLEQALLVHADDLGLLKSKAIALNNLMHQTAAIEVLKHIMELYPDDIASQEMLANTYCLCSWNMDGGLPFCEFLYQKNPNNIINLKRMLIVLNGGDNITRAHQLAKELLHLEPITRDIALIMENIALKSMDYELYYKVAPSVELLTYWAEQQNFVALSYQSQQLTTLQDRLDLVQAFKTATANLKITPIKYRVRQKLNNKIRLGIISPNLRFNCVGYFLWPIIKHLDKTKFELYSYSMIESQDNIKEPKVKAKSDFFIKYNEPTNNITAQSIADDGLDILLEISATNYNLDIITAKPAPIQISWLDSYNALGLPTSVPYFDYIMLDPYLQPTHPDFVIKKPLMLPHTWAAMSEEHLLEADIEQIIPEDRKGYITFGTMNSVLKITPKTFEVWAQIMHMVPTSHFHYVRPEPESQVTRDNFCLNMEKHGINRERISFMCTKWGHMAQYNNIDIALDTFPQTGGTTSCETLWMGVPLVTLVGLCLFERIIYSNLNNAGLGDLCAFSIEEYKNIALSLVHDKARRRYLRRTLRQQILQYPLGKAKQFAHDVSEAMMKTLQ